MSWLQFLSRRAVRLAGVMRREACEVVPDDVDLWPQIEARLRARRSRSWVPGFARHFSSAARGLRASTRARQPHRRERNAPVMAPLFMLALAVWGLVAFAIGRQTGAQTRELPVYRDGNPQSSAFSGTELAADAHGDMLLERVLDTARLEEVRRAGLMNQVSLSQEANGCSAHIKQTYADANRLIIGMTAQVPGTSLGQLRIYGGIASLGGTSYTGKNPLLLYETSTSNSSGTAARLLVYDMSLLDPLPGELDVEMQVLVAVGPDMDPRSNPCPHAFRFNLDIPVATAGTRIAHLERALTVAGETVTLEKIIITPSATQAIVRVGAGAEDPGEWDYATVSLSHRGSNVLQGHDAKAGSPRSLVGLFDGRRSLELVQSNLASNDGTWTLTVDYLDKKAPRNSSSTRERLRGPWTFHFEVPARQP